MKPKLILLLCFAVPLFCVAQRQLVREYSYDAAGNRVLRKTVYMTPRDSTLQTPSVPPDSTETEEFRVLGDELPELETEYFVENIAQVEIKIYPNPATEKITLAISKWDNLHTGIFELFSLTGQLLQEQPVHSATTVISLAGYSKGTYILKVRINGIAEDWKIIKQ